MAKKQPQNVSKVEQNTFLLLLLLATVLFLLLLQPFFAPIFWACAISLLFYPIQIHLAERWGNKPNTIALVTLLICIFVVVIPVLLVLTSFVKEGAVLYARIDSGEVNLMAYVDRVRQSMPWLQRVMDWAQFDVPTIERQARTGALAVSGFAARNVFSLGQSTFNFLLSLALMLYMTFYLLRDGAKLIDLITKALPLGDERERLLFSKFAGVTRATIKGNLVVAIVQGALGGLIFWLLDIPAPVMWGVAMVLVSLIPAVGAALIWLPFCLYLFVIDAVSSAAILLLYGVLVIGLADNVLRPILVGRDTQLPDWLVLISTLGGLAMFGLNGFVIGPLIAAVFIVFWQIFCKDYNHEDLKEAVEEVENGPHIPALFEESATKADDTKAS